VYKRQGEAKTIIATVTRANSEEVKVTLSVAIQSPQEHTFLLHGGAMQQQLREFAAVAQPFGA
jgi:aconitase A